MELRKVWKDVPERKGATAITMAFSDKGLGVARDCADVYVDWKRSSRVCGDSEMTDATSFKDLFAFGNFDGNVYLVSSDGELIEKRHVGIPKSVAVTLLPDGLVTCGQECAMYDELGNKVWEIRVGYVGNGPAFWQGYLFVPDHGKKISVLLKDTGMLIMDIPVGSPVYDVAVCNGKLAIAARGKVALLDIKDLGEIKDLWIKSGIEKPWNVAFSPDCKYVAFTDAKRGKLRVYSERGSLIAKESFRSPPWGVAWGEKLVVGLEDGTVIAYELEE